MPGTRAKQLATLVLQGLTGRGSGRAVGLSRTTVRKLLEEHPLTRASEHSALPAARSTAPRPPGKADSYTEQVTGLLAKYPNITAQRTFEELREAGSDGGYTSIKDPVRRLAPRPGPNPTLVTPCTRPG